MKKIVSLTRCNDYTYDKVKEALKCSVENLGGFEKYIKKGSKVLLKINLLMKKRPEEAATTHPAFVKALAELLMEYGASVMIGDSPGGPFNEMMLKPIYKATGMEQVAAETGATLNWNTKSAKRENPEGKILKTVTITDMINDADVVVSVSKLKTHGMMGFTGAVKNMFGTVPGILKAEYHLNMPEYDDFADALIDICLCAKPVLSFMDGIVGMEGNGPSGGEPRNVGVVLASESPYHLDKLACSLINMDRSKAPTLDRSIERGLISKGMEDIQLKGEKLEAFVVKDFKLANSSRMAKLTNLPLPVKNFVNKHVKARPSVRHSDCVGCGICAKNCPATVITMKNKKPDIGLAKCIRCFCCQELCPEKAIDIYKPRLMRFFS